MQPLPAPACSPPDEATFEEDEFLDDEEGTEFTTFDDQADMTGDAAADSVVLASLVQGHLVEVGSGADGTVSVLAPPALSLCRDATCSSSSFCKICMQARKHVIKLYHDVEEMQHAQLLGSNLLNRGLELPELLRTNLMGLASSGWSWAQSRSATRNFVMWTGTCFCLLQ